MNKIQSSARGPGDTIDHGDVQDDAGQSSTLPKIGAFSALAKALKESGKTEEEANLKKRMASRISNIMNNVQYNVKGMAYVTLARLVVNLILGVLMCIATNTITENYDNYKCGISLWWIFFWGSLICLVTATT